MAKMKIEIEKRGDWAACIGDRVNSVCDGRLTREQAIAQFREWGLKV